MIARILTTTLCLIAMTGSARAGDDGPPPFMRQLFPPDLVMRHQRELDLTDVQRSAISGAIGETQAAVIEIQWQQQDLAGRLEAAFAADPIDETSAIAEVERALELETRIKTAHLRLLIRIHNQLTAAQRRRLDDLRASP